ncbi:MAG TPA: response regulator [Luteitalea sp.]|nr:response regulator [Luteitalea sp.]
MKVQPTAVRGSGRVLLVEDHEDARELYRFYLDARGWEVVAVGRGDEVEASLAHEHIDAIVMDLELPAVDGWELTRRLKANPRTSMLPIIVLSARVLRNERERAVSAGCDGFLAKPCLPEALEQELHRLLGGRPVYVS